MQRKTAFLRNYIKRAGDKQAFKHRIAKEIVKMVGRIIVKLDGSGI